MAKELIRALYARLMAKGDVTAISDLLAPDYKDHDIPGMPNGGGREDLKNAVLGVRAAFPDITPQLLGLIEEDGWVSVHVVAAGHHAGVPFMGIAPSGKPIRWKEIHHFRCAEGRIAEHYGVYDMMGIMQQLNAA